MKKYFDILRNCPLFNNINDENLFSMLGCLDAKVEQYKSKETIIAEGKPAKHIGIVLSGSVQLIRTDYFGNRSIIANIEQSGLFAEAFACAEVKHLPFDVIASESSDILLIDCKRIIYSCSNACLFHSQMIFNLLKIVAAKNIFLNRKSEITSKRTTRDKLMTYLSFQAQQSGSNTFTIPFDRQELADFLEVDRSGLSNEISKLQKEGILISHRNKFELL